MLLNYKNKEIITVIIPAIHMATPLIEPSTSPNSIAFEVPTAWLQVPIAIPAAIGSFTLNIFINTGESIEPNIPVIITAATVTGTIPLNCEDISIAIGVVLI